MATPKVLRDMRTDCSCEKADYCPLEAMLMSQRDYILEQHKLVEFFKLIESQREGKDIGWEQAYLRWNDQGFASKYRQVYSEDKTYRQMRKELLGK